MGNLPTAADLETVLGTYEAVAARDLGRILEATAPDGVLETRLEIYSGHEEVEHYYQDVLQTEFTSDQEALILDRGRIVALTTMRLVGASSGIIAEERIVEAWELEGGLVKRLRVMGRDDGLEQLGLARHATMLDDLREGYEAFNRGDFDGALKMMHPDVVMNRGERTLDPEPIRGVDQLRAFMEPDIFASQQIEVQQVIATDRRVLLKVALFGRTSGTGIEVSTQIFYVLTLRDWLVVRFDASQDRDEAFALLLAPDD